MALADDLKKMLDLEQQEDDLEEKITALALKLYKTRMRLVGAGGRTNDTFHALMEHAATLEADGCYET